MAGGLAASPLLAHTASTWQRNFPLGPNKAKKRPRHEGERSIVMKDLEETTVVVRDIYGRHLQKCSRSNALEYNLARSINPHYSAFCRSQK